MNKRLFSLDALRGLDMLVLVALTPLIRAIQEGWHCFPEAFMKQFNHGYVGFTFYDIIMPLFIYMCGAAIPFALEKRKAQGAGVYWKHVMTRVALLWFLGGLVQGNWLAFKWAIFSPYCNTLQSIAFGYLVVAAVMYVGNRFWMILTPILLAAIYTALLVFGGDYGEFTNFAFKSDQAILKLILPANSSKLLHPSHYTWWSTSMMFAAMAFAGYHSTQILRSARTEWHKAKLIFIFAAVLLAVGFASEHWIPCIKPIFTLSFTAQAMGWCVLALGVLYVLTDIYKLRFATPVLMLYGQLALTAYFTTNFFRPDLAALAHHLGDGFIAHLPKGFAPLTISMMTISMVVIVMLVRRSLKEGKTK